MSMRFLQDGNGVVLHKAFCAGGAKVPGVELMEAKVAGEGEGKHVPVVEVEGSLVTVRVGEVQHPMDDGHFIAFIALQTSEGDQIVRLQPGQEPKAVFALAPDAKPLAAYEYCTKHGLWKVEL